MAGGNVGEAVEKIGYSARSALRAGRLESADALLGGWRELEIDNNAGERALRVVAPGR